MIRTHKLTVLINQTSRKYVVPRNCFYYISSEDHECYILPITPECALELIPENYTGNIIDGKEYRVGKIGSADDVWEMNKAALRCEYCFNKAFIASARKEELEELKDYLCDNKDYLNSLKSLFEG